MSGAGPGLLERVRIRGFRSARDVAFETGALTALVGEASAGKSNILAALWTLLDDAAPSLEAGDRWRGVDDVVIEADVAGEGRLRLEARPPAPARKERARAAPALFLPAGLRSGGVLAPSEGRAEATQAIEILAAVENERASDGSSTAAPAVALVTAVERWCAARVRGIVLLIEEPELFLRPQAQRYLYRLLRTFADAGNQVVYSTHAPAFLNVGRLEELLLVVADARAGTRVVRPQPLPAEEEFRVVSEFDAERSELFLARSALLVEGRTEKLALPFVFRALGYDADREAISIVECGGKPNIPLFARICRATGVPFVVLHDRDAEPGKDPIPAERAVNGLIAHIVGPERTIVLEPDFEAVSRVPGHKPEHAWRRFATLAPGELPEPLVRAVKLAVAATRA